MLAIATVENEVDALADRIAETAAMLDAATHRLLTDIRRFDELLAWHHQGALSMAHWLHWRCGIALGAAREKVRVAHALVALPDIDDALRRGEVSYSKVRAMTRVATADTEATLLEYARSSTASQLERVCRLYRQVTAPRAPARDDCFVRVRETDDGFVRIEMQLLPDEAARVLAACDGRVALGSYLPRAPTDPDVRISRIRFVDLRFRCVPVNAVDHARRRQRILLKQSPEVVPRHLRVVRAAIEPLAPSTFDLVHEASEGSRVPSDAVVRVVSSDFLRKHCVLLSGRSMPVVAAPLPDPFHSPCHATRARLAHHHCASSTG